MCDTSHCAWLYSHQPLAGRVINISLVAISRHRDVIRYARSQTVELIKLFMINRLPSAIDVRRAESPADQTPPATLRPRPETLPRRPGQAPAPPRRSPFRRRGEVVVPRHRHRPQQDAAASILLDRAKSARRRRRLLWSSADLDLHPNVNRAVTPRKTSHWRRKKLSEQNAHPVDLRRLCLANYGQT